MDIIIEAQELPVFLFSSLTVLSLIGTVFFIVLLFAGATFEYGLPVVLGAGGSALCFAATIMSGVEGADEREAEMRASMMATISDQYEISSLEKAGEKRIADCTPGSPADNKPYAWVSENPDTLHEGVLVKTAEVDGECLYTLYPKTSTTPPLGG